MSETPAPTEIAAALVQRVMGQEEAVREMSVALAKKLAGLRVGNILMIGSSGTGKTTLMRAVEG
jgi:ATP-dependent Clp protease ATP-binding subunit ClpA